MLKLATSMDSVSLRSPTSHESLDRADLHGVAIFFRGNTHIVKRLADSLNLPYGGRLELVGRLTFAV